MHPYNILQLIKLLTDDPSVIIGHGVDSQTSVVATHSFMYRPDVRVTFVDTPGFEDSREGVSDVDILQQIVDFLGTRLVTSGSGATYTHDFTANLMDSCTCIESRTTKSAKSHVPTFGCLKVSVETRL
jgi:hypothetical protein